MKNDVVDWCAEHGAGWTSHSMESGQKVVKALTSALWYLESHYQKFEAQGLAIPKTFSSFQGTLGSKVGFPMNATPEIRH